MSKALGAFMATNRYTVVWAEEALRLEDAPNESELPARLGGRSIKNSPKGPGS